MKKSSCALFALTLFASFQLNAQVQGQWAPTGSMQSTRDFSAQARLLTGRTLSMGGVDGSGNLLASAELYSSTHGTWTLTGSMAHGRELFPAVVLTSGKVLVPGGMGAGGTVLAAAELYDPTTGTWSAAGSLSVPRYGHTATLLSSGKVLVAGGCTASGCSSSTAVSELYDPASNSWSITGSLNMARRYHTAMRLKNGKVLAIGGWSGTATTSCELYDPSTGKWTYAASSNATRYLSTATLLPDGKVLAAGGTASRYPLSSAELYDPTANAWTLTGSMTTGRYAHSATLLPDGTVVVAGGEGQAISCGRACTGYIPTAKTEIYSEATGKFTAGPYLSRAMAYHSSTLLTNGRALVNGGIGTTSICCVVLNVAQVYTPLTMTFSASSLNFGVLEIGLTSASQSVTVTNVSSHSATFTSIASSGDFIQNNNCPVTLNAGQSCAITASFKPIAAGTRTGAVTLQDNDPGSPTQTIALTGIGATYAITPLPGSLSFAGQIPGTTSAPKTITLYNDGAAAVTLSAIRIAPSGTTFVQTNNCPAVLNPNTNCAIQIVFTPPDTGNYSATLSVTDNSAGSPHTASLAGVGLD